ncbi:MAG: hypothetical protein AAGB24_09415 [Bacteroidota bacterium]
MCILTLTRPSIEPAEVQLFFQHIQNTDQMPVLTPKMSASVPCDGKWHKIYVSGNVNAHVFVQFKGATCTFTARLIENPPPPPAGPDVKREMVIPTAGGWRGLNGTFDDFEVKCEPAAGEGEGKPKPDGEQQQQGPPEVEASHKKDDAAPAADLHECPFEWYMSIH